MLVRALIVLLIVLNLGVAVWWAARSDPAPVAPQVRDDRTPRLQLLSEVPRNALAKPKPKPKPASASAPGQEAVAATGTTATTPLAAADLRCHAFGPFDDAAAVEAARKRLQPQVSRLHVRRTTTPADGNWRVWLPPLADRPAAQAMAERIAAAGFGDYYIVPGGEEANSIALGLYGSEASARRREAALHAGGFADARAQPMGAPVAQTWIDVAAGTAFDASAERAALGVAGAGSIDCKTVP